MEYLTRMDELAAVNLILAAMTEAPVSSLSGNLATQVIAAKQKLQITSIEVQTEGWLFNTEENFPLPQDRDGIIAIPQNAMSVDFNQDHDRDPIDRGSKAYDRLNHTYKFDRPLYASIKFGLAFDEMPQSARSYIAVRAARSAQMENLGSGELARFSQRDEDRARAVFVAEQAVDQNLNFLNRTNGFKAIMKV